MKTTPKDMLALADELDAISLPATTVERKTFKVIGAAADMLRELAKETI